MAFVSILSIFVLACLVGYYAVRSRPLALHLPRTAATEAISLVIIVGALIAGPASAAPKPALLTVWQVQPPASAVSEERLVGDGELVLKQALLPAGLATLDTEVADAGGVHLTVRPGTQLIAASTQGGRAYCALESLRPDRKTGALAPSKGGLTLCFLDADGNGRFERVVQMPMSISLPMVQGAIPKDVRPVDLAYTPRPSAEIRGDYWVGIRYEQYFNIYGNRMFFLDYGHGDDKQSLTDFAKWKSKGPFPLNVDAFGARVAVVAAEPKGARLRVEHALPAGPFAVVTFTTTTFIPIYR